jgi:hypothetical protein
MRIFNITHCWRRFCCYFGVIKRIKNATLECDTTRTIGNVFENYAYFKKIQWKKTVNTACTQAVYAHSELKIEFLAMERTYKESLKSVALNIEFCCERDQTFRLKHMCIETVKIEGNRRKYTLFEHEIMQCLRNIYANEPIR